MRFVLNLCGLCVQRDFHEVSRREAYSEVPQLLEKAIDEFPLRVRFKGEAGFDTGGVCREMFTCFWEAAYKCAFDGSSLLLPVLHPHLNMSMLPHMGLILSHGYLLSGVFPTQIAFPALAYVLLGHTGRNSCSVICGYAVFIRKFCGQGSTAMQWTNCLQCYSR